ncbi:phosphoribosyltransferase [Haloimpatiens massiliensis]|uniref:phosphoribosyltransferase n=1 Tax=Haloimpatiens massiliensis TaxID=1658110 RepID=UPI000C851C90|nr:phosphoribosyltransferase family protein [Haloimpatiens massiliensis]
MKHLNLSIENVEKDSLKLAQKIQKDNFKPDCIVYIKSGGYLVAKVIADYFNTNLTGFRISREGNSIKTKLSLILRIIPTSFKNLLREIEFKSGIHKKRSKRLVTEVDNDLVQGQNILLIDDSIDTGHTIITALDFLKKFCGDNINIKVAALNKFKLSEELVTTDYYIYEDCIIIYPWSRDSKEYNNFLKLYNLK